MAQLGGTQPATRAGSFWDWQQGWLWPKVLSGALYGLRPGRLGLAFFTLVIVWLLLSLGLWIDHRVFRNTATGVDLPALLPRQDWARIPWDWFVQWPLEMVRAWPVTTLVFIPISIAIALVMLGGIARIAASEIAVGKYLSWSQGLAFAARAWRSLLGAVLGPIIGIWLIAALVALFALLLLRWPGVNILGALLFPIVLLGAFVAASIALIYLVGVWLMVPAVMCDGADAIDAVQRAYSYVIDRPLRLLLYLVLAWIGVLLLVLVVGLLIAGMLFFAGQASDSAVDARGRGMLWHGLVSAWHNATPPSEGGDLYRIVPRDVPEVAYDGAIEETPATPPPPMRDAEAPEGTFSAAARIIRFWALIASLLVPAALLSCATAAATMVYLAVRRVCDGQDMAELWTPGKVEEAMAASMDARAAAAPAPAADLGKADYE